MSYARPLYYRNHRSLVSFVAEFWRGMWLPAWLYGTRARSIIFVLVTGAMFAYIVQTNHTATSGYQIQALEKRVSELSNDTQKLQSELASYQSMTSIQERLKNTPMVEASIIRYLKPPGGAVAQR